MDRPNLGEVIDLALPDAQVISDVLRALHDGTAGREVTIEFETGDMRVPRDTPIALVTKAYFREYYDIGLGSGYRVQVAVGGVREERFGVLQARYCFATLHYNDARQVITIDFHKEMR